jgi:uncharacterized PurR-regulated membrane protein YhhQ (DUF165 family)
MFSAASATATVATGLFAGFALSIHAVEHPTRIDRPEDGHEQFKRSYPRAARIQARSAAAYVPQQHFKAA